MFPAEHLPAAPEQVANWTKRKEKRHSWWVQNRQDGTHPGVSTLEGRAPAAPPHPTLDFLPSLSSGINTQQQLFCLDKALMAAWLQEK